jgi:hypothetical protein
VFRALDLKLLLRLVEMLTLRFLDYLVKSQVLQLMEVVVFPEDYVRNPLHVVLNTVGVDQQMHIVYVYLLNRS